MNEESMRSAGLIKGKQPLRDQLARDVEAFKAQGGVVEQLKHGESSQPDPKLAKKKQQQKRRGRNARFEGA